MLNLESSRDFFVNIILDVNWEDDSTFMEGKMGNEISVFTKER